jgi:signal transduction histidine kinase
MPPRAANRAASTTPEWDLSTLAPSERVAVLAGFFVAYAFLVYLGYVLKESALSLTILWPAAGLLFVTLVLMPLRQWPWIVLLQLAAELVVGYVHAHRLEIGWTSLFLLGNSCDGVVGALIVKHWINDPTMPRLVQVAKVIAASAIGAAGGALVGAAGAVTVLGDASYLNQMQIWWAGNWLGTLVTAPVTLTWVVRWRFPHLAAATGEAYERVLLGTLILGSTAWIFGAPPASPASLLNLPFVPLACLVIAAFRLAPRWVFSFSTASILLASAFASRELGPFAGEDSPFARVLGLQVYLATVAAFPFMISVALFEKRRMMAALTLSRERYRNFVARSAEAVWRIELREGMPLGLPIPEQLEWLRNHAYIAECNRAYKHFYDGQAIVADEWGRWSADVPWAHIYVDHIEAAARQEYSMDGLRFTLADGEHWLASFSGVIENEKLIRIWGVARDITELVQLNERLSEEQQRLHSYAQELTGAEEQARRATAIDLHDGIGQMLVGLAMSLDAAALQATPALRPLVTEMRSRVSEILAVTRRLIADLSPPGLYDLGLGPALEWLRTNVRSHDGLRVDLELHLDESRLDVESRVLVFKVVRELLRNVVKHAGVKTAAVRAATEGNHLSVDVQDDGVGFEAQPTFRNGATPGFGLWSIADRLRCAGGDISIRSAPGQGCTARITLPLDAARDNESSVA